MNHLASYRPNYICSELRDSLASKAQGHHHPVHHLQPKRRSIPRTLLLVLESFPISHGEKILCKMPKETLKNNYVLSKTAGRGRGQWRERKTKFKCLYLQGITDGVIVPRSQISQKQRNCPDLAAVLPLGQLPLQTQDLFKTSSPIVSCYPRPLTVPVPFIPY